MTGLHFLRWKENLSVPNDVLLQLMANGANMHEHALRRDSGSNMHTGGKTHTTERRDR